MVQAQQMQNRGMQVIYVHRLLDRLKSEIVSCAMGNTPLHAASGKQSSVIADIPIRNRLPSADGWNSVWAAVSNSARGTPARKPPGPVPRERPSTSGRT